MLPNGVETTVPIPRAIPKPPGGVLTCATPVATELPLLEVPEPIPAAPDPAGTAGPAGPTGTAGPAGCTAGPAGCTGPVCFNGNPGCAKVIIQCFYIIRFDFLRIFIA